jgi:CRISPR-associated endonuclease/helicase Cas3
MSEASKAVPGPRARRLWAKSDPETGSWHPLWCHLIDVGMVAEARWERLAPPLRARVAAWLHLSPDDAGRLVAWLAAAHDLGKATPDFQSKVAAHWSALDDAGLVTSQRVRQAHGVVSGLRIADRLRREGLSAGPTRVSLAMASAIHHGHYGEAPDSTPLAALDDEVPGWCEVTNELGDLLCAIWPLPAPDAMRALPRSIGTGGFLWLAAFISVSDWVGSNVDLFGYGEPDADVEAYVAASRARAVAAVAELSIESAPAPAPASFEARFGFAPRSLQTAVRELVEADRTGIVFDQDVRRPDTRRLTVGSGRCYRPPADSIWWGASSTRPTTREKRLDG